MPRASAVQRYVVSPGAAATGRRPARSTSTSPARASMAATRAAPSAASWSTSGRSKPAVAAASTRRWAHAASAGSGGRPIASASAGRAEEQVALRVRADRGQLDAPRPCRQRRDPVGLHGGQVGLAVQAVAEREEALAERAAVERLAAAADDRLQRERDARAGARAHPASVACSTSSAKRSRAASSSVPSEPTSSGLAGNPDAARRTAGARIVGEIEVAEALVQQHPAVDRAGHGGGADVVAHRHRRVALGAQGGGVGAGAGPAGGVEADELAVGRAHDGEQVAAEAAQVGGGDGDRGVGGDRRIDRVAAPHEDLHRRLRRQLVGRRGHRPTTPGRRGGHELDHRPGPYRRPVGCARPSAGQARHVPPDHSWSENGRLASGNPSSWGMLGHGVGTVRAPR